MRGSGCKIALPPNKETEQKHVALIKRLSGGRAMALGVGAGPGADAALQ
jgi:hypothetical protein